MGISREDKKPWSRKEPKIRGTWLSAGRPDNAEKLRRIREAALKDAQAHAQSILADAFLTTDQRIAATRLLADIAERFEKIQKERDYWVSHKRRKSPKKVVAAPNTTVRVAG